VRVEWNLFDEDVCIKILLFFDVPQILVREQVARLRVEPEFRESGKVEAINRVEAGQMISFTLKYPHAMGKGKKADEAGYKSQGILKKFPRRRETSRYNSFAKQIC